MDRYEEETVEQTVQRIFAVLLQAYKKNNRKAINYFHFVVHPTSFSSTIENIFHVSFLVRDGFVKLYYGKFVFCVAVYLKTNSSFKFCHYYIISSYLITDNNGMPVIEPAADAKKDISSKNNKNGCIKRQNFFTIDMALWKVSYFYR